MSDGDFGGDGGGGDDGGSDGGAFDLNNNGSSLDEFVLLAVLTENGRAKRSSGGGPAKKSGCLLPAVAIAIFALVLLAI
ncbi:MAG: hypothetical protein NTV27_03170 [Chloroflexi bacterium]|jgi:hypothetical protein|nr:hypothetical protein [Chloroflexota bacterium]